jgi:isocitrate dehydrogenase (NAD+)
MTLNQDDIFCFQGVVECLKIVTRTNSARIAKFAFDYATKNDRKKVI